MATQKKVEKLVFLAPNSFSSDTAWKFRPVVFISAPIINSSGLKRTTEIGNNSKCGETC